MRNIVIGIYYHPEAYPPTLNAIGELSGHFNRITVVHRPNLQGSWKYPSNVTAIASGRYIPAPDQEKAPIRKKIGFFLRFVYDLLKACRRDRPQTILLYDSMALFAYRLIRPFLFFRHRLWYHNHDITETGAMRKYSIGWLAGRAEPGLFKKMDLFTLPSAERLRYFPMDTFKGKSFVVPNYPALRFYTPFYQGADRPADSIRLIFQGRIGPGHGLEEIIPLLGCPIEGRPVRLLLKGHCHPDYKEKLIAQARARNAEDSLSFAGFTPYEEVPRLAATCHIGIGIFSASEVMHVTLGTASNKLYEYAALGLPVLYLGREHFTRYLGLYPWAVPVELSPESITRAIAGIMSRFAYYSASAHESFAKELNFERYFAPVIQELDSTTEPE